MGRVANSDEGRSGGGYPALSRVRDRLQALGVDTDYWTKVETTEEAGAIRIPDELPESPLDIQRDLASVIVERGWWEAGDAEKAFRKDRHALNCQVLILLGDFFVAQGRPEDALRAYALAIDVAPTPQAQLELGYLIGLRGRPQLPYPSPESGSLLLRASDAFNFEALASYLIVHEDLMPKPEVEYPEPSALLRIALEAYGRVYGYYLTEAVIAGTEQPPEEDMWNQQLVLDGMGTLMSSLGEESAFELISKASNDWCEVQQDGLPLALERRLALWQAQAEGEQLGRTKERQLFEAIRQLDRERQSTQVIRDPDKLIQKLDEAVARFPAPRATRAEIEREWASVVGDAWTNVYDDVRRLIIESEWLRGVIEREDGSDYGAVAVYYGRAIEALLCKITNSNLLLHQFAKKMTVGDGSLSTFFRTGAPLEELAAMVDRVARPRNDAAHTARGAYRRTDPSTVRELREIIGGSADKEGLLAMLMRWRSP